MDWVLSLELWAPEIPLQSEAVKLDQIRSSEDWPLTYLRLPYLVAPYALILDHQLALIKDTTEAHEGLIPFQASSACFVMGGLSY